MTELLGQVWFWSALAVGVGVGALAGMLGVAVVVERRVFLTGGVAHAAYGGVGLAFALGVSPFWGAVAFAMAGAVALRAIERRWGERADTLIGVLWSLGMAVGAAAIDRTPGYAPDLMSYLFGSMLLADPDVVRLLWVLLPGGVLAAWLARRPLAALLFDPEWSELAGAPVRRWHWVLDVLTALVLMLAMRLVGLVLVMALVTVPAALALPGARSLVAAQFRAAGIAAVLVASGLLLSAWLDLRSGAGIVLLTCLAYLVATLRRTGQSSRY